MCVSSLTLDIRYLILGSEGGYVPRDVPMQRSYKLIWILSTPPFSLAIFKLFSLRANVSYPLAQGVISLFYSTTRPFCF